MIIWTICGYLIGIILALILFAVLLMILFLIGCGLVYGISMAQSKENWITRILDD